MNNIHWIIFNKYLQLCQESLFDIINILANLNWGGWMSLTAISNIQYPIFNFQCSGLSDWYQINEVWYFSHRRVYWNDQVWKCNYVWFFHRKVYFHDHSWAGTVQMQLILFTAVRFWFLFCFQMWSGVTVASFKICPGLCFQRRWNGEMPPKKAKNSPYLHKTLCSDILLRKHS